MSIRAQTRRKIVEGLGWAVISAVILVQVVPIVLIVLFSFNATSRLSFPFGGFSTRWYSTALAQPGFQQAFENSLTAAVATAVIAGFAGFMAAFALQKVRPRARGLAEGALGLPNIIPPLLIGVGLSLLTQAIGIRKSIDSIVAGHVIVALPFVFGVMRAKVAEFDFSVIDAARDLGASPSRAFFDITLPLMRTSMVSAGLMAAALSMDEFIVTSFTRGNADTVPTLAFGLLRRGVDPTINAMATMVLAGTLVLAWGALLLSRKEP